MEGKNFDLQPATTKANSDLATTQHYSSDSGAQQIRAEIKKALLDPDLTSCADPNDTPTTLRIPTHDDWIRWHIKAGRPKVDLEYHETVLSPEEQAAVDEIQELSAEVDKQLHPEEEDEEIDLGYDEEEEGPENYDPQKHRLNAFELRGYLEYQRYVYDWPNVSEEQQTINDLARQLTDAEKELKRRRHDAVENDEIAAKEYQEKLDREHEIEQLKKDLEQTKQALEEEKKINKDNALLLKSKTGDVERTRKLITLTESSLSAYENQVQERLDEIHDKNKEIEAQQRKIEDLQKLLDAYRDRVLNLEIKLAAQRKNK